MLAGCSDDPGDEPTPTVPAPTTTQAAEPTGPAGTTTPPETATPGDLPGEAVEIHPYEGGGLGVMGVGVGDVLHLREGPGVDFDSITGLDPLTTGIVASGHNRQRDDGSSWSEVEVDGVTGWASPTFLAYLGHTSDITSELAELPSAPTVEEAGALVAELRAGEQPPSAPVVVVDGPRHGDLAEVVLDVTGYGDDALAGERLHVFAVEDGDAFTVRTVEATLLCLRGVSDGLCL